MKSTPGDERIRHFAINGLRLTMHSHDEVFAGVLLAHLSTFEVSELPSADYSVHLHCGALEVPPGNAVVLYDGEIIPGIRSQFLARGELSWLLIPGELSIRFAPTSARSVVVERSRHTILAFGVMHVIDAALAVAGQYLLHGAALQMQSRSNAVLLFAPSGRGKTTTSLALAFGGFALMTDDAIVGLPNGPNGRPAAWGLPRALKVHYNTVHLLPELRPVLSGTYDSNGEQILTENALSSIAPIAPHVPQPIAAVVILGDRTQGKHIFRSLSKSTAVAQIAHDNVKSSSFGVPRNHLARFSAISSMIERVPTYELRVGDDLRSVAKMICSAIWTEQRL